MTCLLLYKPDQKLYKNIFGLTAYVCEATHVVLTLPTADGNAVTLTLVTESAMTTVSSSLFHFQSATVLTKNELLYSSV